MIERRNVSCCFHLVGEKKMRSADKIQSISNLVKQLLFLFLIHFIEHELLLSKNHFSTLATGFYGNKKHVLQSMEFSYFLSSRDEKRRIFRSVILVKTKNLRNPGNL
jgi:hypothetical protein